MYLYRSLQLKFVVKIFVSTNLECVFTKLLKYDFFITFCNKNFSKIWDSKKKILGRIILKIFSENLRKKY